MEYWLVIPAVILVLLGIIWIAVRFEKKRGKSMKAQAVRLGWSYAPKAGLSDIPSADAFHLFNIGRSRRVKNLMQGGGEDLHTAVYDYQYTVGGGQSSHTVSQTVFQFQSARLNLPAFILKPENVFHKIGQSFGYQDIDFDSYPEFSKRYLLRGGDEERIRKLFNPDMLVRFESEEKGLVVEAGSQILICYRSGKRVKPEALYRSFEHMRSLYDLFVRRMDYV